MTSERTERLRGILEPVYREKSSEMLFHGWHHLSYTAKKAVEFAEELNANSEIVEAAALTHDLNYLVEVNSQPEKAANLRRRYLSEAGFDDKSIEGIEAIISEENIATRGADISNEAKALSDSDTLFKALPITPILFAGHYIIENKIDISRLAQKVVSEQQPLLEQGIYFYTDTAKAKYLRWAKTNLELWTKVVEALDDPDVQEVIRVARELKVI